MKKQLLPILFCLFLFASSAFTQAGKATKIDEWGAALNCEEYLARMNNVLARGQKDPTSTIYVFVYEGKTERHKYKKDGSYTVENLLPQRGLAKARIRSMRQRLLVFKNLDVKSFEFVEAGLRENFTVEFWNVPAGTKPPAPAPTLKKTRYRKGKPEGFCLTCC